MADTPIKPRQANHLVIIADVGNASDTTISVQNFNHDGFSFIPIFSSKNMFTSLTAGSEFQEKGISIEIDMLLSMLKGDETLILNPGSDQPWIIKAWNGTKAQD